MLLVIFGAGASYDSVHHLPPPSRSASGQSNLGTQPIVSALGPHEQFRPPLANQLFENRDWFVPIMQEFGDFRSLVTSLRTANSVERRLAELQKEAETLEIRHCQLAAICYYLQSVIWSCQKNWQKHHAGITNHAAFLETIELWRRPLNEQVCIVTFNYDTMIEQAMSQVLRIDFDTFSRYISDENYRLIKLHGSIDWGREVVSPVAPRSPGDIVGNAANMKLSEQYGKVVQRPVAFDDGKVGFPALAIPVEKKSEFVCPPAHLEALANLISRVTKIIAIGWRATERHFLEMLTNRLMGLQGDVDLMVVSGDENGVKETVNNLAIGSVKSERKRALRSDGFSGLMNQSGRGHLESFLR
jgi:hypothetical protein